MIFTYKQLASLNATEKMIYQYIIRNLSLIHTMSIRSLAKETHVSTATIVRFCNKLNCDGFVEFKLKIKLYQETTKEVDENEEVDMLMKFFEYAKTPSFINKINKFANYVEETKRVVFLGIGTSGYLGQYGARYLSNVGHYSVATIDPYYPPPVDDVETVFVVLSESGETREVIDQIRLYQMINAKIIVITNKPETTIDELSDLSIHYYVVENILPQTYNISSQVPVIYILEQLARELQRRGKRKLPSVVTSRNL